MTAEVKAYIAAITRLRDTGRPVVLPVEQRKERRLTR